MGCSSSTSQPVHASHSKTVPVNSKSSYPKQAPTQSHNSNPPQSKPPSKHNSNAKQQDLQKSSPTVNSSQSSIEPAKNSKQSGQSAGQAQLDKNTLLQYVKVEKRINELEGKNVVQMLQIKWEELKLLENETKKLEAIYQSCQSATQKEKKDVDDMHEPSVRQFFQDQASFDSKLSKEQEEYLEALNKQEFAQKKLQTCIRNMQDTKRTVHEFHQYAEELQKLYKEQDELLNAIFNGKYGSENEYRLEREHDVICERQQRISAAKSRWQAAKILVEHCNKQLGYASQRWDYISQIPMENGQMRYHIATEVRNYLIAAGTNLRNSHNYLKGIDFPYCKPDEASTLERATNNIFSDLGSKERHAHAANVYKSLYQRSAALIQWFEAVINKTIDKDFLSATEELWNKKRDLRRERVSLIKQKLVELFGPQEAEAAGLDEDANLTDARRLQEQLESVNQEELRKQMENVNVSQPERVEEAHPEGEDEVKDLPPLPEDTGTKPEVVPLKDLAPPPSQNQLFGDIDTLKKQYEIDMEEFSRAQEVNRARVEQGLQEKLAARKSRKARKMAQEQETDKLLNDSAGV